MFLLAPSFSKFFWIETVDDDGDDFDDDDDGDDFDDADDGNDCSSDEETSS